MRSSDGETRDRLMSAQDRTSAAVALFDPNAAARCARCRPWSCRSTNSSKRMKPPDAEDVAPEDPGSGRLASGQCGAITVPGERSTGHRPGRRGSPAKFARVPELVGAVVGEEQFLERGLPAEQLW